jgi:hypothetical protein
MRIGALRVWGILLSSYRHQEEHTAWVVVAQAHLYMVTPFKEEAASRQQQQLYDALVAYLHSRQLEVGRGVYTPPKQAFLTAAALPLEVIQQMQEEVRE